MNEFALFQGWLVLMLSLGGIALIGFAFIDALRARADAFPAAGKQTRNLWLIILGIALAVNVASLGRLSIFLLAGVIAGAVYVLDVRPAVKQVGGGRGSNDGPYGPW